jgi:hypothetical protein
MVELHHVRQRILGETVTNEGEFELFDAAGIHVRKDDVKRSAIALTW